MTEEEFFAVTGSPEVRYRGTAYAHAFPGERVGGTVILCGGVIYVVEKVAWLNYDGLGLKLAVATFDATVDNAIAAFTLARMMQ